jgi:membrane protease YdiL (CAAX protease family)
MKKQLNVHVWHFFLAIYALSALLILPVILSGKGMTSPLNTALVAVFTFIPSLLGILFTYLTKDADGRRDFWQRAIHWPRGRTKMAILGLVIMPVIVITSYLVSSTISETPITLAKVTETLSNWKNLLVFLFVELTFGALSEELGWRGYALEELQSHWGALPSALLLGIIWAVWHTPAFLIPGMSQHEWGGIFSWTYFAFLLSVTLGSVIITWVYNNTRRSILVAGFLMHFAQNATMILLTGIFDSVNIPPTYWTVVLIESAIAVGAILLVYGSRTLKRPASSPGDKIRVRIVSNPE